MFHTGHTHFSSVRTRCIFVLWWFKFDYFISSWWFLCVKKVFDWCFELTPNQFSTLKIVFLFGLIKLISSYQNLKSATSNFEILRALNQNQIYLYSVKITNLTKQMATDALLL